MNTLLDPTAMEQVPLAGHDLPASTYALLEQAAQRHGHRTAHVLLHQAGADPDTITYDVLLRRVTRSANALHRLGVNRHDPVALLSPNSGELIVGLLAAEAAGIAQPLNPTLVPEALMGMLTLSGARVLIAAGPEIHPQLWGLAVHLGEQLGLDAVLALRPDGPRGEPADLGGDGRLAYFEDFAAAEPDDHLVPARPGPEDIAAYFHTGGTTGTPKLAAHTHANEVFTAWSLAATVADTEVVLFGGLPMFHVNAFLLSILAPPFSGGRVIWNGPLGWRDPQLYPVFWKLVERFGITLISAVPTVYAQLTQMPVDADLSSLYFAISGAAILPPAVRDAFEKHTSVPICEGYGLTEATCASARIVPGHLRPGSVGLRMPYQHIRAVDPTDGTPLPPDRVGLITISGPSVFPGYVTVGADGTRTFDAQGKVIDGWLDTGDLGRVDADGYVYLTGRAKDVIIRGGHNIDPVVVEDAVRSHPDVTGASAVGRPDRHAGEVPVAYVTVRPGADVTGDQLVAWASSNVAEPAAAPKAVHIMDALPVTAIGKDYKPALRADAIQRVVAEELPEVVAVVAVEDGTPVARIDQAGEPDAVRDVLDQYGFRWHFADVARSDRDGTERA